MVVTNTGADGVTGATINGIVPGDLTGVTFVATGTAGASGFTAAGNGIIDDTVNMAAGSSITYAINGFITSSITGIWLKAPMRPPRRLSPISTQRLAICVPTSALPT